MTASDDYSWTFAPTVDRQGIRPILESFPRLETLSCASVLKENQLRTVLSVRPPDGPGVVAKVYRYRSLRERLRYGLRRSRAEQEWFALHRFRELGLPAARPIGIARGRRSRPRDEGVLLEYLEGCRSLAATLEAPGASADDLAAGVITGRQRRVIELAARWVRRLHDVGAWHRDLHAGNLLVDSAGERLFFIDLHSCWFWPRLSRWQRRRGVLDLLYSLSWSVPRNGLEAFLNAYGVDALYGRARRAAVLRRLDRSLDARNRRRLRSRSGRCFVRSTMFDIARDGAWRVFHLRRYPARELAALWQRELPGRVLKRSRRGWVVETELGALALCVKYRSYSWLESLRGVVSRHRLRRAYGMGHGLWVRRIPTPQVIALSERRWLGLVREAHLVTEFVAGALPLDRFLESEYGGERLLRGAASRRKHELARNVGRFVREIHDAHLSPGDLSPQNILVVDRAAADSARPDGDVGSSLQIVDLDDLRIRPRMDLAARAKNLVQAGNLPEGHISPADCLRGLKAYARGQPRYWNREWIRRLGESALAEHLRVLLRRTSRARSSRARSRGRRRSG